MSRSASRDWDSERSAVRAAAGRLLAGTPLRSATGKLTGTELIAESGLRGDVVYGDRKDLAEEFQAPRRGTAVRAAGGPGPCRRARCAGCGTRHGPPGTGPGTLRHRSTAEIAAELELDPARSEMAAIGKVAPLPPRGAEP